MTPAVHIRESSFDGAAIAPGDRVRYHSFADLPDR